MKSQDLRPRVGLIVSTLGAGGAERSVVGLATGLQKRGYDTTVMTFSTASGDFYRLPETVNRVELDLMAKSGNPIAAVKNNIRRIQVIRQSIKRLHLDVVISFMDATNVLTLLAAYGLTCRVLVSERIDPAHHQVGHVWAALRRFVYRHADEIVVQTSQVASWIRRNTSARSVRLIPNFLSQPAGAPLAPRPLEERPATIIAAGRLHRQKGFDLLLQAFSLIKTKPELDHWTLQIYGDGKERDNLLQQIKELKLEKSVTLMGISERLVDAMLAGRVFVLSSRNEGFPNVLLEAMSAGCAVCGFREVSGVSDLIQHGQNGLLVDKMDAQSLANSIYTLCNDTVVSHSLAVAAHRVSQNYLDETIMPAWIDAVHGKSTG